MPSAEGAIKTINAAMPMGYGSANGQQREQLDGYFDDSADSPVVETKKGMFDPLRCYPCTKRRKICVGIIVAILLILIIVIACAAGLSSAGVINLFPSSSALQSGQGCPGSDVQRCSTGECISKKYVCDRFIDCPGAEDELEKACSDVGKMKPCTAEQFECAWDDENTCRPKKDRCNGKEDCANGSDELSCFDVGDEGEVLLVRDGKEYPVKYENSAGLAEAVCKSAGYGRLVNFGAMPYDDTPDECVIPFYYDPDSPPVYRIPEYPDMSLSISPKCDNDPGFLRVMCRHHSCGIFSDYQGPGQVKKWKDPNEVEEEDISIPFPWVVDIQRATKSVCKGSIVNNDWVVTTSDCIDENIFISKNDERTWSVVAGASTSKPQDSRVVKVLRNHFGKRDKDSSDDLIVLQISPPFDLNGYAHAVCLDRMTSDAYCFTTGFKNGGDFPVHVRIDALDPEDCNIDPEKDPDALCYSYATSDSKDCLRTRGSPISCLNRIYERWSMAGIMTEDMNCDGKMTQTNKPRIAVDSLQQLTFNWLDVVTSRENHGKICGESSQVKTFIFLDGSRRGEVYVDVQINGLDDTWYTVYNLEESSPAFDLIVKEISTVQQFRDQRLANNTQIKSLYVAELSCPEKAETLCRCKVEYREYDARTKDASTILFYQSEESELFDPGADDEDSDDSDNDNSDDYGYDYWNDDNNKDGQQPDYYDYEVNDMTKEERKQILDRIINNGSACSGANKEELRMCNSTKQCIPLDFVCDGFDDCNNGDDEEPECSKYNGFSCPPTNSFTCIYTYECISRGLLCDGKPDCGDETDEKLCFQLYQNGPIHGERAATGILIGQKEGVANVVSAKDVDLSLAHDLCYAMGFTYSTGFKAMNYTNGELDGDNCFEFQFATQATPETAHLLLSPSEDCSHRLQLTCEMGCGLTEKREATDKNKHVSTDYPWLVEVEVENKPRCQGALVSEDWILAPRTCVKDLTSDLTVHFNNQAALQPIKVTTMIKFHLTNKDNSTDALMYNAVLLRMNKPIKTAAVHPVCVEENSLDYPVCFVSLPASDNQNTNQHYRVVSGEPEECDKFKLAEDERCMKLLHPNDENLCLKTDQVIVQCIELMTGRFRLAGIVEGDAGTCDGKEKQDLVPVTDLTPESVWIFNAGGFNISKSYDCGTLDADRANRYDEYYMTLRSEGKVQTIVFGDNDNVTLAVLTNYLTTGSEAQPVFIQENSNVTSSDALKVTCTEQAKTICDCDMTPISNKIVTVPTFFLSVPDNDNRFGPELDWDQDVTEDFYNDLESEDDMSQEGPPPQDSDRSETDPSGR